MKWFYRLILALSLAGNYYFVASLLFSENKVKDLSNTLDIKKSNLDYCDYKLDLINQSSDKLEQEYEGMQDMLVNCRTQLTMCIEKQSKVTTKGPSDP
jgi:hypothetical protein